ARSENAMVDHVQGQIDRTVDRTVSAPVRAAITGTPSLDRAMRDQAIDTTRWAMAITIPILFGVLLLLLRAPVAALALTVLGAATSFASLGIMTLLGKAIPVDAVAVTTACMTGLALGVGYGLLLYRRWRSEIVADVAHHDAAHAAATSVETTGRSVLVGGTALIVALLLAPLIADTKILTSIGIGTLLCSTLAVGAATVVMPGFLVLAAGRTEALRVAPPAPALRAWERLAAGGGWVVRRAVPAGAVATALLAVLAIPVLALETGPPSPKLLPPDDPARVAFEQVASVMGPGWPTPYNIVVVSRDKPVTDTKLLKQLEAFQAVIAKDPRVASVTGPGTFAATQQQLNVLPKQLSSSGKLLKKSKRDLLKLQLGLGQAGAGVKQLRGGLEAASGGAGQLHGGSSKAQTGAGQLHAGLDKARTGAAQISGGLGVALGAARKLHTGAGAALKGSGQITSGLKQASVPLKNGLPLIQKMATDVGSAKDSVSGAASSADALTAQLDEASAQIAKLPASPEKTAAADAVASAQTAAGGLQTALSSSASTLTGAAAIASSVSTQTAQLSAGLDQ
ncbi:MAG: MMPL family transporter, partial [Solirubrobacteraceae bacterium]